MNKEEKKEFIRKLCATIAESICTLIDKNKLPENWQHLQLRLFLQKYTGYGVTDATQGEKSSFARQAKKVSVW